MDYNDVRENLQNGKYTAVYADEEYPQALPNGYVTDREKSVAWNEEQVEKSIRAQKRWSAKRREIYIKVRNEFCSDLESAIMDDLECNRDQAYIIFDRACTRSDDRYGHIEYAQSYADLIRRFVDAKGETHDAE